MSVQAIGWVLDNERRTRGATRLVLLALANHAGEKAGGVVECYPSLAVIAREANVSKIETVRLALRDLEALGIISTTTNAAPDARIPADKRPNLYRFLFPSDPPRNGVPSEESDPPRNGGATPRVAEARPPAERRDDPPRNGGQTVSEPSIEPSLEPSLAKLGSEVVPISPKQELAKARDKVSRELLNRWWEGEVPRPAQPYVACLRVVGRMLEVGWSPDDVFFALTEAPVVSTGALTMALKQRRKSSTGTQTQTLLSMMVTLDGMSVEDQEIWWKTEGPGRLNHG